MKRMTFVLALIVLMLASPFYVGMQMEKDARAAIEQAQWPGYQFSLQVDRGYRQSLYSLQINFDPAYFLADDMTPERRQQMQALLQPLLLPVRVEHGPLLLQPGPGFGLAAFSLQLDAAIGSGLKPFLQQTGLQSLGQVSGRAGFTGDIQIDTSLEPFRYLHTANGVPLATVQFNGLSGQFNIQGWGQAQSATTRIEPVSLEFGAPGERARVELGAQQITADFQRIDNARFLSQGQMHWHTDALTWTGSGAQGGLQQLDIRYQAQPADTAGTFDLSYLLAAQSLSLNGSEYSDLALGLAYLDINASVIESYMQLVIDTNTSDEAEMQQALMSFASSQLPLLLESNPGLALDPVRFRRGDQSFEAGLNLHLDGDMVVLPLNPANPAGLMYALNGSLNLDLHEDLAESLVQLQVTRQIDQTIAANPEAEIDPAMRETMINQQSNMMLLMAAEQGFIERSNGRITTDIGLNRGLLDINGFQLPLPF